MKTEYYNKLVRDKIPEIIEQAEQTCKTRILEGEEYDRYLRRKLIEEAKEVAHPDDLFEDIADVLEVVEALMEYHQITKKEILQIKKAKNLRNGSFSKHILLEEVYIDELTEMEMNVRLFAKELKDKDYKQKTISQHLQNISVYTDEFLKKKGDINLIQSMDYSFIGEFFSHYIIRKCKWVTPFAISQMVTSLKKFYQVMYQHDKISKEQYDQINYIFKESLEHWKEECKYYLENEELQEENIF